MTGWTFPFFFFFFLAWQRTDQTSLYNLCQWSLWCTQAVLMGSSDKAPFESNFTLYSLFIPSHHLLPFISPPIRSALITLVCSLHFISPSFCFTLSPLPIIPLTVLLSRPPLLQRQTWRPTKGRCSSSSRRRSAASRSSSSSPSSSWSPAGRSTWCSLCVFGFSVFDHFLVTTFSSLLCWEWRVCLKCLLVPVDQSHKMSLPCFLIFFPCILPKKSLAHLWTFRAVTCVTHTPKKTDKLLEKCEWIHVSGCFWLSVMTRSELLIVLLAADST